MIGFQTIIGSATALVVYGLIIAGVIKMFQVHSELQEIKELMKDIRRNTQHDVAAPVASPGASAPYQSPEDLIRALHREGAADRVLSEQP